MEPRFSDDRQWWWTGSEWVPASQAPIQSQAHLTPSQAATSTPPKRSGGFPRWLVIAVGILFFPITVVILVVRTKWSVRTKAIVCGVWSVAVIAAGISGGASSAPPPVAQSSLLKTSHTSPSSEAIVVASPSPIASPSPSATASPKPTPTPSTKPLPVPVQTTVRFVNAPLTASRGSYATLKVKTAAKTSCFIEVDYKSGASTAAGLGPKSSDGAGNVSWTWKVGATTTRGSWPITVTCGTGSGQTHITVI